MSERPSLTFLPAFTVRPRANGGFVAELDWSSSYDNVIPEETPDEVVDAVCEAVDAWAKTQPRTFVIREVVR